VREALATVSAARLAERIEELGAIGRTADGGVTRLGLTTEEESAKTLVSRWLAARGARITRDAAANLIASFGERDRPIVVASHLDSVPNGGRFDGHLGVLCAVEMVEAIAASGAAMPRVDVIAWTDEEGARFGVGLFGSAAAYGRLPGEIAARRDRDGISVAEALRALRSDGDPTKARRDDGDRAYVELHIEQGPNLERMGRPLGIVSTIVGITHLRAVVEGSAGHAGTTPMEGRRDALVAAAEMVLALEDAARRRRGTVATVGEISAEPGAKNVIPGRVVFTVDVRSPEDEARRAVVAVLEDARRDVEKRRAVRASFDPLSDIPAVALDTGMRRILADSVRAVGVEPVELVSGAGHDAQNPALAGVPTGMLFIRSTNGSHNPREHATAEDAARATQALILAVSRLAERA
jgi:hydantoinase/carbamoylase family amidase